MKKINTYLFDFDGTLVNSQRSLTRVFQIAYESVGVKITHDDTLLLMRIRLEKGYEIFKAPTDEESIKKFVAAIRRELDAPETLKLTEPFEDTKEVITSLYNKGYTLGIVTSNAKNHVQDVLKFLDLDEKMFSVIIGNEEVERCKPDPDPVNVAVNLLGVDKSEVAYVGDGLDDMRCASAAGVLPVLIDRLDEYRDSEYQVIKSLKELL